MGISDEELQELEDPATWDWESAERRQSSANARSAVQVTFSQPEFEELAAYTELYGLRLTDFIRRAALDAARSKTKSSVD
jgi:hypothetical protein